MYGQIHVIARGLVLTKFGQDTWDKVVKLSKCDIVDDFMVFHNYGDAKTLSIIGAIVEVLGLPKDAVLEVFGEYFLIYCLEHGYDKMLRTLGDNLEAFIQNLDALHELLSMSYKDFDAPSFRCETQSEGRMILHYYSVREGLHPIVIGLLRAVGRELFDDEVTGEMITAEVDHLADGRTQHHVTFSVTWSSGLQAAAAKSRKGKDTEEGSSTFLPALPTDFTASTFCSLFPFHIVFMQDLQIVQWGQILAKMTGVTLKPGLSMGDVFYLSKPRMALTFEHIMKFINAVYLLKIEVNKSRVKHAKPTKQEGLTIKGQMVWMNDTKRMIFLGSPRLSDLSELLARNVYLSNIPVYDVTRELVLLNQQRIAEIEVSKKLDETTAELKKISVALEVEKAKTDMLLYQMLPMKVADALREGRTVDAEKFDEVTILFSDIVTFTNIAAAVTPIEVVNMLNELYMKFDHYSSIFNVYKVETIGDAYMVVGGVPEASDVHAESVANMSIAMLISAGEVNSPATGKPLQIRVGLHSGPVVAGVVGKKMPRYCLFGDTVNTASRMESHGLPGKIHVSGSTYAHIKMDYELETRGTVEIKGKGLMTTYFLLSDGTIPDAKIKPTEDKNGKDITFEAVKKTGDTPDTKTVKDNKHDEKVTKTSICGMM